MMPSDAEDRWIIFIQEFIYHRFFTPEKLKVYDSEAKKALKSQLLSNESIREVCRIDINYPIENRDLPEMRLISHQSNRYSEWSVIWKPRAFSINVLVKGKKLGINFQASGLVKDFEIECKIALAYSQDMTQYAISFLEEPRVDLSVSIKARAFIWNLSPNFTAREDLLSAMSRAFSQYRHPKWLNYSEKGGIKGTKSDPFPGQPAPSNREPAKETDGLIGSSNRPGHKRSNCFFAPCFCL
eukprot:TRINITY_DN14510_c0_g1_i1.p1 TRINITY_DN14510_c0_g1~~TRINITY_DN14510_c0_g1_i1.p1  ORF type:complete len:241 (-),score=19.62 TRINITY_DN14510_c0_g1_i1:85-807(-)